MLWYKNYTIDDLQKFIPNTILEHIGIEITELTDNSVSGKCLSTAEPYNPQEFCMAAHR